jgi:cytochrome c biogenesis protein CcmG, thiol:disulfide interchange protein DsbE
MLTRVTGRSAQRRPPGQKGIVMKTRTLALAALVALALVTGAVALSACGSASAGAGAADVQMIAPGAFKAADYAGKPLVVNVFGSWCPPCNLEAPDLATFAKDNPGVQVIGIASEDSEKDAVAFMHKYSLQYPLVVDDGSLVRDLGISAYPTTIFYDAQGKEQERLVGASTLDQFNASLTKAQ